MNLGRSVRTRPKKLNSKQNVAIFRDSQIEGTLQEIDTAQRSAIETGVEKAEEAVRVFSPA